MTERRALVCAPVPPEFDRESGSRRLYHFIEFLQESGWAVSFVAQNVAGGERHMRILRQRGVATYERGDKQIEQLVCHGHFDLALFAFWYLAASYLPVVRALSPTTRVIVDSVDLHFLRHARRAFQPGHADGDAHGLDYEYACDMAREVNTYAAADTVLTVSGKEADLVNDLVGDQTARLVPDCDDIPRSTVPFTERRGILFVGNFRHPPNIEAARFFCEDIVPRLDPSVVKDHPIYIVGNGLEQVIPRLGNVPASVRLVGWVPEVEPYLSRARVSVVPLLNGAGTKRKLVQSLMCGTPSVATTIGVEGLDLVHGTHVLVADEPAAFADGITALIRDRRLWSRLAREGHNAVRLRHGRAAAKARFLRALDATLARTPKRWLPPNSEAFVPQMSARRQRYTQMVGRITELVRTQLSEDGPVVVVSKGDDALVKIDKHEAWHFPQDGSGQYAGHYPAESAAAIEHLERLRSRGARFLVFPQTSLWWLDHYPQFREHLERRYRIVVRDDDTCVIFGLGEPASGQNISRVPAAAGA